jgi:hypothetical protein
MVLVGCWGKKTRRGKRSSQGWGLVGSRSLNGRTVGLEREQGVAKDFRNSSSGWIRLSRGIGLPASPRYLWALT